MMGGLMSDATIEISVVEYCRFVRNTDRLDTLITAVLDCAALSYSGEKLRLKDEEDLMALMRFLYPEEYDCRLEELHEKEDATKLSRKRFTTEEEADG